MDLFEILFILLFVLFPIMEQVLKRRRQSGDESEPGAPGQEEGGTGMGGAKSSPDRAEEMVPDDLWAILTGERRPPGGVSTEEPEEDAPWSSEPDEDAPWSSEPEPVEVSTVEEGPGARDVDPQAAVPGSREYRGPEAYSLETLDHPATSLERPIRTPEARHRAFHARRDRQPTPQRPRTRSATSRALRNARTVRQAFILTEVLGPPKGLQ